jgi:hypothetical protein
MSETGWVSDAYYARFENFPPVLYWRGTVRGLQALMMWALERGTPLTADELMKVQGHSEAPPEAKTDARTGRGPRQTCRAIAAPGPSASLSRYCSPCSSVSGRLSLRRRYTREP